jgi:acetolactate synthase-1/2/3 large subunit
VYVGAGCRDASAAVLALVESMQCPFVTTPQAKGILPETHPLSLRNAGISSSLWARSYCAAGPDFTIALGTDLDDASTAGTPPVGPNGTLVHVVNDASIVGRNYETAFAISCDVLAFAKTFREIVRAHGGSTVGRALAVATRSTPAFDVPDFDSDPHDPIAPHRVIADLEEAVPPDTTFVSDIGEHMLFALHYLTSGGLRRFAINTGLGSMASGIAASVGIALGDPSRTVVCICGDGGMQMAGMEILVAIERRLPIVFAVFNDARYNLVYHGHRITFGHGSSWSTPRIDFVQWAQSLGVRGALIERPGEIRRDLIRQLTAGGMPAVLDIRQDASIRIGGDGRLEALRQMSMGGGAHR